MTPEKRKKIVAICYAVLIMALASLGLVHLTPPFRIAAEVALLAVMSASTWMQYQDRTKAPRDTMIHLFPATPETSKERS